MGAIYLLDKGYVDFFRLFNHIHKNEAFYVTRAKDDMLYEVLESKGCDSEAGIISDEVIKLTGIKPSKCYPETLRMVTYESELFNFVYLKLLYFHFRLGRATSFAGCRFSLGDIDRCTAVSDREAEGLQIST